MRTNIKALRLGSLLAEKNYALAVVGYTKAIDLDPTNAIYYGNRAIAHLRCENAGLAFQDANKAVELDPQYAKVRIASLLDCVYGLHLLGLIRNQVLAVCLQQACRPLIGSSRKQSQ